jgi:DNA polymerase III subunit alpha
MTLHCHSTFSQLDGIGLPEDHAQAAKEAGLDGLALTDHSLTSGWIGWEDAFQKEGLNPLFGVETYFAIDRHHKDKEALWGSTPAHMLLIAQSDEGLKNINRIVTDAYLEGFYGKPRTDFSVLREFSEGVIASTGCVSGPVGRFLSAGDLDRARSWIADAMEIFDGRFYLELQPHPFEEQIKLNKMLCDIDGSLGLNNLILTNDSHYPKLSDKPIQAVSNCIATKSTLANPAMSYDYDFHVKSYEQIYKELQEHTGVDEECAAQAVENTKRLLTETRVSLPRGLNLTPEWPNAVEDLDRLLEQGFNRKVRGDFDTYRKRLQYERKIIVSKGFAEYFLVVADMVQAAKDRGVFVGSGRGSAGGSLVAYLLDITEVDPIKWDLGFERFISPERGGYKMTFHNATEITELKNWYEERVGA